MLRTQKEILAELDRTLDQLMQNASIVSAEELHVLDALELNSLQKTQESLLARFSHTQEELSEVKSQRKYENLHNKVRKMNELNSSFMSALEKQLLPRIGRNRRRSKKRQFAECKL
jgi:hypothetical protein